MDPVVMSRAAQLLGDEPERLAELAGVVDLLTWISASMARLQDSDPHVPPPAVVFRPELSTPDFWRGPTAHG